MSIFSKLLSQLTLFLCLILICVLGAITAQYPIFVPFLFTVIYGCAYIFWKVKGSKFPYYFHIGLLYLIINNQGGGVQAVADIVKWGLLFTLIALVITGVRLAKKGVPLYSTAHIVEDTIEKYRNFFKENPAVIQRTLVHCLIIFAISWAGYFVYDHNGYWLIISTSVVVMGEEYGKITVKGKRRILGTLISMIVLGGLVFFKANTVVLVAVAVISMLGIGHFMPGNYIMGSACINIHVVASNILASGDLSYRIVGQRVLWTILGAILTLVLCYVCDQLLPTLYQDYTKEKLIAAKNERLELQNPTS